MGEQLRRLQNTKGSLEAKLKDLWTSHLESAATSVTDYLSVEHLGSILEELTGTQLTLSVDSVMRLEQLYIVTH
ncbi:hypothetical protein NP493_621g02001 [Ridgeia piscesae]|uniref:Uncharacterized protein n=1 Tax=Ridgeia piscesae TaxID=27915 RepID=A0AAD9KUB7_RIDPI|nr:hypothetical protein NP493_621g02001 [Ridgeia piscesae]